MRKKYLYNPGFNLSNRHTRYFRVGFIITFYFLSVFNCWAQKGGLAHAVLYQHFGKGNTDPSIIGPPLPARQTQYIYSTEWCPPRGSYTIARIASLSRCFNISPNGWVPIFSDKTSDYDNNMGYGYMMLVNNVDYVNTVYVDTIEADFCSGTVYNFSAAILNLEKQGRCMPAFPRFAFLVEPLVGRFTYASAITGVISYQDTTRIEFGTYGVDFSLPAGVNKAIFKIVAYPNPSASASDCGIDFAIDDIVIQAKGPDVNINFGGRTQQQWVMSACYQDDRHIKIEGNASTYYINTTYQWEQSTDGGTTWQDIPGENSTTYERNYPQPDTFLYRLRTAEAGNIANKSCGVVSNILKVEIDDIPPNITVISNSPVCSGHNLQFNATGGASYEWTGPNGFYDNIEYAHIYFSSLKDSGWYYVTISSVGGCKRTDSTYAKIIGTDVRVNPDTSICVGERVQLEVNEGVSYVWSPAQSLSDPTGRRPLAKPSQTTTYVVSLTDKDGCIDTAQVNVFVRNKVQLIARILSEDYLCMPADSIRFSDNSSGIITSRLWDFGNGNRDTVINPAVQFYQTTNANVFPVRLSITDTAGCKAEVIKKIKVANMCNIAVPTAFTPNNDGLNDWLAPLNAYKAKDLKFSIYDRNGQLVFETNNWTIGWNGKRGDQEQPSGVYMWILQYTNAGKKIFSKGTTLLMR